MGDFAVAIFAVAVVGVPVALVLATRQKSKRGCGRGCASCGNRHLCHPGQYPSGSPSGFDPEDKT